MNQLLLPPNYQNTLTALSKFVEECKDFIMSEFEHINYREITQPALKILYAIPTLTYLFKEQALTFYEDHQYYRMGRLSNTLSGIEETLSFIAVKGEWDDFLYGKHMEIIWLGLGRVRGSIGK